jgi:hypothetical protein
LPHFIPTAPQPRIKPYLSLHAEAEAPDDLTVEEDEEAMPTETGKAIELENNLMMEADLTISPSICWEFKEGRERYIYIYICNYIRIFIYI